jgi:hypothetical protein
MCGMLVSRVQMVAKSAVLTGLIILTTAVAYPCDVVIIGHKKVSVATEIVRNADVIVRATALGYSAPPGNNRKGSIRFNAVEVIRGDALPELILDGELVDWDDFNGHSSPYEVVRPNGLSGTCYAWQYRTGAQYLLMLKKATTGGLTVNWYALAPVNEQLRSPEDPWLLWVRARVEREEKSKGLSHKG